MTIEAPDRGAFVEAYGHLFEHSPWVVERAWEARPFAEDAALHDALMRVVAAAGEAAQLALIRAHPELGVAQALTKESESEQTGAGLKSLNGEEFTRFAALNAAYREKFGFPFVICVRLHDKKSIFTVFAERLKNEPETERAAAIREIGLITRLRLADMEVAA